MALPINLQDGEELVEVRKRHPVYVILKSIAAVVIAGLLIWGFSWLSGQFSWASSIAVWLYVAVVVVAAGYLGLLAYRFYNDLWIVTNQRLVDALRKTPFNQELSSTDLINVQDINIRRRGIMPTIFNFGDVVCQTASTQGEFIFIGVGDPAGLMEMLDRLRDEARKEGSLVMGRAAGEAASQRAAQAGTGSPASSQ